MIDGLADALESALPNLGTAWMFHKLDGCDKCTSGPRASNPPSNDNDRGMVELAFRGYKVCGCTGRKLALACPRQDGCLCCCACARVCVCMCVQCVSCRVRVRVRVRVGSSRL